MCVFLSALLLLSSVYRCFFFHPHICNALSVFVVCVSLLERFLFWLLGEWWIAGLFYDFFFALRQHALKKKEKNSSPTFLPLYFIGCFFLMISFLVIGQHPLNVKKLSIKQLPIICLVSSLPFPVLYPPLRHLPFKLSPCTPVLPLLLFPCSFFPFLLLFSLVYCILSSNSYFFPSHTYFIYFFNNYLLLYLYLLRFSLPFSYFFPFHFTCYFSFPF